MRGGGGQLTLYIGLSMVAYNRSDSISFGLKALLRGPKQEYQKARARTAVAQR